MAESAHDIFMQAAIDAGKQFLDTPQDAHIHLVSHFDTDGLCARVIIEKALQREGYRCTSRNEPHLNNENLDSVEKEDASVFIFTDIGANRIKDLGKRFTGKTVIVLDHHAPGNDDTAKNVQHINPHVYGITQRNAISGSGVAYFFALGLNAKNRDVAYLAVLGAIGDTQERSGFEDLNNRILQHAIVQKNIAIGKRLKLYGLNSRPLIKVLEYSTDISIPGVTNNPRGVKEFLDKLNISYEWKGRLKKYFHLRPFEKEKLTKAVLDLKRDEDKEKLIVPCYTLLNERRRELQDLKEYATIINACGRLEDYETAVKALNGDDDAKHKAIVNLRVYKSAIRDALHRVDDMRANNKLLAKDGFVIINFKDTLRSSLVGIIASILARNKHYPSGTVVCTMARQDTIHTKVSLRVSQDVTDIALQKILWQSVKPLGVDAGGHNNAAGAIIPGDSEESFIENLKTELEK